MASYHSWRLLISAYGMETPELIELRKKKIEAMDGEVRHLVLSPCCQRRTILVGSHDGDQPHIYDMSTVMSRKRAQLQL